MTTKKENPASRHNPTGKLRLVAGSKKDRKKVLAQLPQFKPIIVETDIEGQVAKRIRPEICAQRDGLLTALGIDPRLPDAFERGFTRLAHLHHGVGAIAVRDFRPPNRNAAKWSYEQDDLLVDTVKELQGKGHTKDKALRMIAADKKFAKNLPHPSGPQRTVETQERRYAQYKKRLQELGKPSTRLMRAVGSHLSERDVRKVQSEIATAQSAKSTGSKT